VGGTRPRYYLMAPHEIPGCEGHRPPSAILRSSC
jgi:hypothetical protein